MNYLVYTPFRCGSSYLTHILKKNTENKFVFLSDIKNITETENLIIKGHDGDLMLLDNLKIDYVFTNIRKPTEIFISSYFKDFKNKIYDFYYEKDVSLENLDDMVKHFLSFDWGKYNKYSYNFNYRQIKKITGINIWDLNFDKNSGASIYTGNTKLVITTHKIIHSDSLYPKFIKFYKKNLNFKNLNRDSFSFRNSDIYGNIYNEFIKKLPDSFYRKYNNLDKQIINKFF